MENSICSLFAYTHKKSKKLVDNYQFVSLLPICSKIYEKLLFDSLCEFLEEGYVLNSKKWWFQTNVSSMNQFVAILYDTFITFDTNIYLVVFFASLELSKVFKRVYDEGPLFKLKRNGIDGSLLCLLELFSTDRWQWLVGVPQALVLGSLLFLIYINDLTQGLHTNAKLFADNASLFSVVDKADESASKLNCNLIRIQDWAYKWEMSFNPDRTKPIEEVIFLLKTENITYPNLYFNNLPIVKIASQKHLRLNLDVKLTFNDCINKKMGKAIKGVDLLCRLPYFLPCSCLLAICKSFIRSHLRYGDVIYDQLSNAWKILQ